MAAAAPQEWPPSFENFSMIKYYKSEREAARSSVPIVNQCISDDSVVTVDNLVGCHNVPELVGVYLAGVSVLVVVENCVRDGLDVVVEASVLDYPGCLNRFDDLGPDCVVASGVDCGHCFPS